MKPTKHILVVGNYQPDRLQSMKLYADTLLQIYSCNSTVKMVKPPAWAGRIQGIPALAIKYLAYIDKFLLFLWLLFFHCFYDLVHISDHGYAYYSYACLSTTCFVTCHDLLAVRGAKGDTASATVSSPIGIWLQRLIMAGLRRADAVVFVSEATYADFKLLIRPSGRQRHAVIPNPLNAPFISDPSAFPLTLAEQAQIPNSPFLLMVGNALPRKNRGLASKLLVNMGPTSPYRIVLAGVPFTEEELFFHHFHPLGERLVSIPFPSHGLLNRLYCQAHALLFPSFAEGFGWPIVEAQTCLCPVIASSTTSIPEVAGHGALYAQPTDVAAFAAHVRALEISSERARLVDLGLANTRRFNPEVVGEAYRRFASQA